MMANRLTGDTRNRSMTPLSSSMMMPMPFQPPPKIDIMMTMPGVTNVM